MRRLLGMFRPVWFGTLSGIALSVLLGMVMLPVPILFGRIIDRLPEKDFAGAVRGSVLILACYLAFLALIVASRYLILKTTKTVIMRLRSEVVLKLQQMSIGFYDREDLGLLHSRVIQDTEKVDVMANFVISTLMVSAVQALGAVVVLWLKNWQLTLLLLVVALAFWGLQAYFKQRIKLVYGRWRIEFDTFSAKVLDLLQGIRLVRAFATEDREARHMIETAASLSHRGVEMVTTFALFNGLVKLLTGVSMMVVLMGGAWFYIHGQLTPGDVVGFFTMLGLIFDPLGAILNNIDQLFGGQVALEQVFHLLDHPDIEPERLDGLVKPLVGRVEFRGVYFTYPGGQEALVDASMSVAPGQTVALVGASGAGKTTFINLLLGFYRPGAGQVLVDDVDLRDYQTRPLRAQMAVVAQDNVLLSGTVRSNVLYGRPEAGDKDLEQACRMACAWDFIQLLPQGLDTEVGEKGVKLSGGQRQRLAIARALLRDPRILILDEATSALDSVSERSFQQALENLRTRRTTLIIAHRLSTVKHADVVLVFDQGRIVERGSHASLLELHGAYARLFATQWQAA
jgi:ATP-binding cassette subfamily B protein